jgi:hypothetical protein
MSLWNDIKEIKSSAQELRSFAFVMAAASAVLGAILLWKPRPGAVYCAELSLLFLITGILIPRILKPLQKCWMGLALTIGWGMSRVILTVLFCLIITPIGLFLRLTGKDLLDRKPNEKKATFWSDHVITIEDKTRYEKQF